LYNPENCACSAAGTEGPFLPMYPQGKPFKFSRIVFPSPYQLSVDHDPHAGFRAGELEKRLAAVRDRRAAMA
jgi:hypothetical protein